MRRTDPFAADIGNDDAAQPPAAPARPTTLARAQTNLSGSHEVTRLLPESAVPSVAKPAGDAALLRLVEEQACDLVKLRRALIGANSLAEERRRIIAREIAQLDERPAEASPRRSQTGLLRKARKTAKRLRSALEVLTRGLAGVGRSGRRKSEKAKLQVRADRRFGYRSLVEYSTLEFLRVCESFGTDLILDVGANRGQFAQSARACGYTGHIVSFEPLTDAHVQLESAAANDALWDVVERCAVGAAAGEAHINIASNSYSSSLLPMLDRHSSAAPGSAYRGIEPCRVITLDDYVESTFSDATVTFGLKCDTQGYEGQVLTGARRSLSRIKVIMCEMSLVPLYDGAPTMLELCRLLAAAGYRCVAMGPEFEDPKTGELLQVNGIFVHQ